MHLRLKQKRIFALATVLAIAFAAASAVAQRYNQTNIVSDIPGLAITTDPNLKNAWGIAFGPGNPIWIAYNGTGLSTLYDGAGNIIPLVVTIPAPSADNTSAPTGLVSIPVTISWSRKTDILDLRYSSSIPRME